MEEQIEKSQNEVKQEKRTDYIDFEDFVKVNLRVGTIKESAAHPDADKLLVLKVDLGEKDIQIVAGIKKIYAPEDLIGQQIVVVENLKPRKLRGVESQGMLLAASNDEEGPILISTQQKIGAGSRVG